MTNQERIQENNAKIEAIQQTLANKVVTSGEIELTENNKTYDVSKYASAKTNIAIPENIQALADMAIGMITYTGSHEIYIPTDPEYTHLRDYCYSVYDEAFEQNLFYKHNLSIPENITDIGFRVFLRANLTGVLTIPSSCTNIESNAFEYTNIEEVIVKNGVTSVSSYLVAHCPNLKKATFLEPIAYIPAYCMAYCPALEEVYLPSTLTNLATNCFYKSENIKFIKFTGVNGPTTQSSTFKDVGEIVLLVPYEYYNSYYTTTNFLKYGNPIIGYGEFNEGDSLPSSIEGYTITWHTTLEDAKNVTNAVTTCPSTGTMYGAFTPVA